MKDEKRTSIGKVIVISAAVAVAIVGVAALLYRLFKKYFKITIDCGSCDDCDELCFDEFDPLCDCDEDFEPACSLDDADEE